MNTLQHPTAGTLSDEVIISTGEVLGDDHALEIFLSGYKRKSPNTLRAYEKECKRFLLWVRSNRQDNGALLPDVTVQDINNYLEFLGNPRPFSEDFLKRNGWKHQPFRKALSSQSTKHTIIILHQMFHALRNLRLNATTPYCLFNPVVLAHNATESTMQGTMEEVEQALSKDELLAVFTAIEMLPQTTDIERKHYHRARWIMHLLYRSFLRREEAAQLTMGSFEASPKGWSIRVLGKRNKLAKIICTDALLDELILYRESLGLSALPSFGETRPAILNVQRTKTNENEEPISAQVIYEICKVIFEQAAQLMEAETPNSAQRLRKASPHWMRHTGVSHSMEVGIQPRYVQAQARHSSLNTTARYDHKDRDAWREEFRKA